MPATIIISEYNPSWPELFAAEKANALVLDQGISFREAYRRVAAELEQARNDGGDE